MWHASLSFQVAGRLVPVRDWSPGNRRRFERALRALLRGVGVGARRWEHGTRGPSGDHVLHLRRSLSDDELVLLPDGPPAAVRGGEFGGLYRCMHVAP